MRIESPEEGSLATARSTHLEIDPRHRTEIVHRSKRRDVVSNLRLTIRGSL